MLSMIHVQVTYIYRKEEFERVFKRRKLRVNESKSKVMKCTMMVNDRSRNVTLNMKVA